MKIKVIKKNKINQQNNSKTQITKIYQQTKHKIRLLKETYHTILNKYLQNAHKNQINILLHFQMYVYYYYLDI